MLAQRQTAVEISQVVNKLATLIVDTPQSQSCDTWADGLKGIISNTPTEHGKAIAPEVCATLLRGLTHTSASARKNQVDADPQTVYNYEMMVLDTLKELLCKFGDDVQGELCVEFVVVL